MLSITLCVQGLNNCFGSIALVATESVSEVHNFCAGCRNVTVFLINPLFEPAMNSALDDDALGSTPPVRFGVDPAALAANIAQGSDPNASSAMPDSLRHILDLARATNMAVVEVFEDKFAIVPPGIVAKMCEIGTSKAVQRGTGFIPRVIFLPDSQQPTPAGEPSCGGQEGLMGATNQTLAGLADINAQAADLLRKGTPAPQFPGALDFTSPDGLDTFLMGGIGQGAQFGEQQSSQLLPNTYVFDSTVIDTKSARAVLPERFGMRTNVALGAAASDSSLTFALGPDGSLRASNAGRSTFLSDSELLRQLPDMAAYTLAAQAVGSTLFSLGRLTTSSQPLYQHFIYQQLHLYSTHFNQPGGLLSFLKFDRTARVQQHLHNIPWHRVHTFVTPTLFHFMMEAARPPNSFRGGPPRGGGQQRIPQLDSSPFRRPLPIPRHQVCFHFARFGQCNYQDCPRSLSHRCLYCNSSTHGSYQCNNPNAYPARAPAPPTGQGQTSVPHP